MDWVLTRWLSAMCSSRAAEALDWWINECGLSVSLSCISGCMISRQSVYVINQADHFVGSEHCNAIAHKMHYTSMTQNSQERAFSNVSLDSQSEVLG